MIYLFVYFLYEISFSSSCLAQWPSSKKVIHLQNLPIEVIIDSLSTIYEINFSYDASLIKIKTLKTLQGTFTIYDALTNLFDDQNVGFDIVEKQIVLYRFIKQEPGKPLKLTTDSFKIITGKVVDNDNNPLPFASIQIPRKGIATVSNNHGFFQLKVPTFVADTLMISYIGYKAVFIPINSLTNAPLNITLKEETVKIPAVIVQKVDAWEVVKKMIDRIPKNYKQQNIMYSAFYRETARDEDGYISIVEALVDIAKAPYSSSFINDQARIFKGRKVQAARKLEKLSFKLEGGIYNNLRIDVIKEPTSFLFYNANTSYTYKYLKTIQYNNRLLYVIAFSPSKNINDLTYEGKLYIDRTNFALVGAIFSLTPQGIEYARTLLIRRTPKKTMIKPVEANYTVFYRLYNNYWYLDYSNITLKVKARSQKLFFNTTFTSSSQMVVTDIDTTNHARFRWSEIIKSSDIIVDKIENNDDSFWGNHNIIVPDESIMEAFNKLNINSNKIDEKQSFWNLIF